MSSVLLIARRGFWPTTFPCESSRSTVCAACSIRLLYAGCAKALHYQGCWRLCRRLRWLLLGVGDWFGYDIFGIGSEQGVWSVFNMRKVLFLASLMLAEHNCRQPHTSTNN